MIHYVEFDTTAKKILADLEYYILQCSDWARIGVAPALAQTTAPTAVGGSTFVDVTTTAGLGLSVGSVVSIGDGDARETRLVTGMTAGQLNFATPLQIAHPAGSNIRLGNVLLKATTTRGAQMVVDLAGGGLDIVGAGLNLAVYQSHDGTTGVGKTSKYVQWRYASGSTADVPLHVVLSVSKEHIFFTVEGPRPGEANAASAQYGSFRNYFFLADLVPYDEEDVTPVVVAGGGNMVSVASGVQYGSHTAHVSRNLENTGYWDPVRLASLQVPNAGELAVLNVQRQRELDDRYILAPYVVFSDADGMRGRLSNIFFAGFNQSTEFSVSPPPIGARVQYQGLWYKLVAANKGDGNRSAWGPLGAIGNESTNNYQRSIVVGVQCLP